VLKDRSLLHKLEEIIHPMVWEAQETFLRDCSRNRYSIAALDIPLLFENGADKRCDLIAVVTAPEFLQKQRVLNRSGMTEEKYASIKSKQLSDQLKRKKADFIINTGIGRRHTFDALSKIIFFSKQSKPKIWRPGWLKTRG
jgi:dephospho-CoA kinase